MTSGGPPSDPSSFSFEDDDSPSDRAPQTGPEPVPEAPPADSEEQRAAFSNDDPDHLEVQPDPQVPESPSRLSQAREARAVADEVSRDAYRSLWVDVLTWPVKSSTLPAVLLLLLVAALLSFLDGGSTRDIRTTARLAQIAVGAGGLCILGIYARRIVRSAVKGDRPVPWFRDREDELPWWKAVADFMTIVAITMIPLGIYWLVTFFVEVPVWADRIARPALCLLGAAQIPLAIVAYTVKDSVLAAGPFTVRRVWRAEPHAARVAGVTAVACVALMLLSFAFAAGFAPRDVNLKIDDHTALRTAGRVGLTVLRFAALYAALVSFRVAGLLVHEVPEVRETLR